MSLSAPLESVVLRLPTYVRRPRQRDRRPARQGALRPMSDAQLRAIWMLRCALCTHEPRGDVGCQRDLNRLGDALQDAFAAMRWERVALPEFGACGTISITRDEAALLHAASAVQHDQGDEARAIVATMAGAASPYLLGEVVVLLAAILGGAGYWLPEPDAVSGEALVASEMR